MKKLFLTLALLVAHPCAAGEPDKALHEKCLYPTVLVWSDFNSGSGVVVKSTKIGKKKYRNTVFSAAHVVKEVQYEGQPHPTLPPFRIYVPQYKDWSELVKYDEYQTTVKRVDRKTDAAVLTFDSDVKMRAADIDWHPKIYIGNSVTRIGGGLGQELRVDQGQITSVRHDTGTGFPEAMYRTNIFTVPGDSGAPLFHENKVVGICQSIKVRHWDMGATRIDVPMYQISMYITIRSFTTKDME